MSRRLAVRAPRPPRAGFARSPRRSVPARRANRAVPPAPARGALMDISMSVADSTTPSTRASMSTPESTWIELREETALLTIPRHSTSACLFVISFIGAPRSLGARYRRLLLRNIFSEKYSWISRHCGRCGRQADETDEQPGCPLARLGRKLWTRSGRPAVKRACDARSGRKDPVDAQVFPGLSTGSGVV